MFFLKEKSQFSVAGNPLENVDEFVDEMRGSLLSNGKRYAQAGLAFDDVFRIGVAFRVVVFPLFFNYDSIVEVGNLDNVQILFHTLKYFMIALAKSSFLKFSPTPSRWTRIIRGTFTDKFSSALL